MPESEWSSVDGAAEPRRLLRGLDELRAEPFFAASKVRMATLLDDDRIARVLDVGRGTGEDAVAFSGTAIGIESSVVMCTASYSICATLPLLYASGDASYDPADAWSPSIPTSRPRPSEHWTDNVSAAWQTGTLRYRCIYLLGTGVSTRAL